MKTSISIQVQDEDGDTRISVLMRADEDLDTFLDRIRERILRLTKTK